MQRFIYCVHLKSAFQTSQPERARCLAKEFSLLQHLSPPLWRLQVLRVCDIFICCYLSFHFYSIWPQFDIFSCCYSFFHFYRIWPQRPSRSCGTCVYEWSWVSKYYKFIEKRETRREYDNSWEALGEIVKILSRYDYGDDYGGFFGGGFPSIFGAPRVRVLVVPVDEVLSQF